MIYTVQGVCRYLHPRDIRAMMCVGRDMCRVIRALTDAETTHETVISRAYIRVTFREMIWSKIGVTFKCYTSVEFDHRFYIQPIIMPTSRDYTGPIVFLMKAYSLNVYYCMWTTDGYVDRSAHWWGDYYSNISIYKSMGRLHFTDYINEIIRNEIVCVRSIREDNAARLDVTWAIIDMCSHHGTRERIIHSAEFAEILREI